MDHRRPFFQATLSIALGAVQATMAVGEDAGVLLPRSDWQVAVTRQTEDITCLPAALSTLLRVQLGLEFAEMDIASEMLGERRMDDIRTRGGFALGDALSFVEARGMAGWGERGVEIEDMAHRLPAILQTTAEGAAHHFVVVLGERDGRFAVADPAIGGVWMSAPELSDRSTGIAFFIASTAPAWSRIE